MCTSIAVPVMSETIDNKGGVLTSSIMAFLNLGPDVLNGPDNDLPKVKTKIDNEVNNVTQTIEGTKSINGLMGVEISKALAKIVSLLAPNQTDIINIVTISICKPSAAKSDSCDNADQIPVYGKM